MTRVNFMRPSCRRPAILRVRMANMTDRAHSEPKKVRFGMRGISLEIPVERAIIVRGNERIAGSCEVIHSDVLVSSRRQLLDCIDEELQLFRFRRQIFLETLLLAFQ